jgi:ABC-type amino acid transport substrate-binding protein
MSDDWALAGFHAAMRVRALSPKERMQLYRECPFVFANYNSLGFMTPKNADERKLVSLYNAAVDAVDNAKWIRSGRDTE